MNLILIIALNLNKHFESRYSYTGYHDWAWHACVAVDEMLSRYTGLHEGLYQVLLNLEINLRNITPCNWPPNRMFQLLYAIAQLYIEDFFSVQDDESGFPQKDEYEAIRLLRENEGEDNLWNLMHPFLYAAAA